MSDYRPDRWVVVKIKGENLPTVHKVFASWYGGYAGSDSWKLNSGIVSVTQDSTYYYFEGSSGSVYECSKHSSYGTNGYGAGILNNMIDKVMKAGGAIEVLPEDTNWMEVDYE